MSNPNALQRNINDLGVHSVPPATPTDPRVRLAEEDALQAQISAWLTKQSRTEHWKKSIDYSIEGANRRLNISGHYYSAIHPAGDLQLETSLILPALDTNSSIIKRNDRVYLVLFGAIAGSQQDIKLGQIDFQYLNRSTNPPTLAPVQKENAKRSRVYWLLVSSTQALTAESFHAALPDEPGGGRLTGTKQLSIANLSESGFALGSMTLYARDENLAQTNYPVLKDFVEVTEICQISRIQNFTERGYTYGNNGEESLSVDYNLLPVAEPAPQDWDAEIRKRLFTQIFSGRPGRQASYAKTVQNLTAGLVGGNPGRAGESAGSPNGSVCLANGDRISFTNQAMLQTLGVQVITATNDGSGNAVVTAQLNANSPSGSYFSEKSADHKIYRADGTEQSELGRFINLGGSGSLIWIATPNSTIAPGQQVYFVPAIRYPAGSGFSIPFEQPERVWVNGTALQVANLRSGEIDGAGGDLVSYQAPASPDNFIVVFGKERAALHYIYKRVQVTTDVNGVAIIPAGERGCFAFIEGVSGRVNAPVRTGLTPNTTYNALVYYPPRGNETWQIQFRYTPYQGTGQTEPEFLNGAVVVSRAYCFLSSQGGGNSVFQSDANIRFSPVSMHLPGVSSGLRVQELDAPIRLGTESNPGDLCFREINQLPGAGLALPTPGQMLSVENLSGLNDRSLNAVIRANGQTLGFRVPALSRRGAFQAILVFLVKKNQQYRLVIATRTGFGGENIALRSDANTAIDTFRI